MPLDRGNILRRKNVKIINPIPAVIRNVVATRELHKKTQTHGHAVAK